MPPFEVDQIKVLTTKLMGQTNTPYLSFSDMAISDGLKLRPLLLDHEPADRREVIDNSIREAFAGASISNPHSLAKVISLVDPYCGRIVYREGTAIGAILVKNLGGGAAVVLAAGLLGNHAETARAFWEDSNELLKRDGVRFVQWMRGVNQEPFLPDNWGFVQLATLDYLSGAPEQMLERTEGNKWLEAALAISFHSASSLTSNEFIELIRSTYDGSLDCPDFYQYRTAAEVVESYRQVPGYLASDWQYITNSSGEKPLGCLIATPYQPSQILELTYMGLIPEARGRGLSRALIRQTAKIGLQQGLQQIVLAVDRQNIPAIKLYQAAGMELIFSETAWVRKL